MRFYSVTPPVLNDSPEGEDETEYYSSYDAALKAYKAHVDRIEKEEEDFAIKCVELDVLTISAPPTKNLILRILNRKGWVTERKRLKTY